MFIDTAKLAVRAGKGGDGVVSFRRERWVAKGGPDGGDGGKGGDVIFIADHNLNTLAEFRHTPQVTGEDGGNGQGRRKHGKNGADKAIKVPVGTVVWEDEASVADLTRDGQSVVVARGGKGGFGNAHFKSSTRQAPEVSEVGEPGEEKEVRLELKLLADVGLVGLPNAGKSTLLSVVSNAKPEIADYPFTTLIPNLGVVSVDDNSFLMADIPGLIEGASNGKGLGDEFLRHVERTAVLLHLIDGAEGDVAAAYKTIMKELKDYPGNLAKRPQIVVLTKVDGLQQPDLEAKLKALKKLTSNKVFAISAVAHQGVTELLRETVKFVELARKKAKVGTKKKAPAVVLTLADDPDAWWVEKNKNVFTIKGQKIEGFAKRTNFDQEQGVNRLKDIMKKLGITRELIRLGVRSGDDIAISTKTFKW